MNSGNPIHWTDPSTWPWIVYVWLAMLAVGWLKPIWRWIRRNRLSSWPTVTGQIESVTVSEAKWSFFSGSPRGRGNSPSYVAELGYSYSTAGKVEAGFYKREFGTEGKLLEFVRGLNGKPLVVHCNPNERFFSRRI